MGVGKSGVIFCGTSSGTMTRIIIIINFQSPNDVNPKADITQKTKPQLAYDSSWLRSLLLIALSYKSNAITGHINS